MIDLTVHSVNRVAVIDVKEWDNNAGKYESQKIQFLDKDDKVLLEVTAFSKDDTFFQAASENTVEENL